MKPTLDPALLIIFGITGDLAKRKLLPALYHLFKADLVPEHFEIIGITRQDITVEKLMEDVELCINEIDNKCDPKAVARLHKALRLHHMNLTDPAAYEHLLTYLNERETAHGVCMNRLYYLSIPPQVFGPVVRMLGDGGHNRSCAHGRAQTRLLVEKPFGYDLASAKELVRDLSQAYKGDQVYRIDHYLAKETVQNILTFRFDNPVFRALWDAKHIQQITIRATETLGIQGRSVFYEQTGALRDLIQSHLLQLLALVTMEQPKTLDSKSIHQAKLAALMAVEPIAPNKVALQTVRGQYETYQQEAKNPESQIETFAALRLQIRTRRWKKVPVVLYTGKNLAKKSTDITIVFSGETGQLNCLIMRVQPNEGITLELQAKKPGLTNETETVQMDFDFNKTFSSVHPDAYERVLLDAVRGDTTLFATAEEVLASWRILDSVIHSWERSDQALQKYTKGSEGPSIEHLFML